MFRRAVLLALVFAAGPVAGVASGSELVVSKQNCNPCSVGIGLVDAAGGHARMLTKHTGWEDNGPVFSPDGSRIAFSRTTDGYRSFHIYVMRSDGHGVRRITSGHFDERPAWSPTGNWIAYQSIEGIQLVRPDGTGRHLVAGTYQASDPSWSPDGRSLAFSQHRYVWTARLDGNGRHRVIAGFDPSWSPNGRVIAFMPSNGGVAVVARRGGHARFLTPGMQPAWSPDGHQIAYTRWPPDNRFYVWVMNADGSHKHLVLRNARTPSWRP
jgi:Tol biopolymer transport system component